ncbi:hypothetical protein FN846DRAFT_966288 [Sphaerosporella brunnea]|uniref:Copper acquisition factor BIM1-like domain-containing protein n=1 Tax=Sphaerosporella brunnea TaxID=1250544 RepID=A0A5J5ELN0_9PEZI|nr:hypothetical protein FN846DRAFT_966288 [Sphaerosporella brunnea]
MHAAIITLLLTFFTSLSSAHYALTFPYWRGPSFPTQWDYPCGGMNQSLSANNRTLWPLSGGAIALTPTHPWAQTYINLGLGSNVTGFNISLVGPFNQTSNGTFCLPEVKLPADLNVQEGTQASIQVVQLSHLGGALYNCADITFSKDAKSPGSAVCFNSTGVGAQALDYDGPEQCNATTGGGKTSGATGLGTGPGVMLLVVFAGVVAVFMV